MTWNDILLLLQLIMILDALLSPSAIKYGYVVVRQNVFRQYSAVPDEKHAVDSYKTSVTDSTLVAILRANWNTVDLPLMAHDRKNCEFSRTIKMHSTQVSCCTLVFKWMNRTTYTWLTTTMLTVLTMLTSQTCALHGCARVEVYYT